MHRRAFLAQFLAAASGAAIAKEATLPDGVRLHHGRMEHRRTAPAKRLVLTFEGPGCDDLARQLKQQYPEAFIWKD